jgi:hypothetical protein
MIARQQQAAYERTMQPHLRSLAPLNTSSLNRGAAFTLEGMERFRHAIAGR